MTANPYPGIDRVGQYTLGAGQPLDRADRSPNLCTRTRLR